MAKKYSLVPRQHFVLLVNDMPIFSTAAIATIAENGARDVSMNIILVPSSHERPVRKYLFIAFCGKKYINSCMLAPKSVT